MADSSFEKYRKKTRKEQFLSCWSASRVEGEKLIEVVTGIFVDEVGRGIIVDFLQGH